MNKHEHQATLRRANELYRSGDMDQAFKLYQIILLSGGPLAIQAKWNIERLKRTHCVPEHQQGTSQNAVIATTNGNDIAVICHLFHKDGFLYLKNCLHSLIPIADFYLTGPFHEDDQEVKAFTSGIDNCRYYQLANLGRDIRPFLKMYENVKSYSVCLKTHTKKGALPMGELWKKVLYDNTFGSDRLCQAVIREFNSDPDLALMGSSYLFLHGKAHMHSNQDYIEAICEKAFSLDTQIPADWGFIAGTVFWFRPSHYQKLLEKDYDNMFSIEEGRLDGAPEHAFERILGLSPYIENKRIKLIHINKKTDQILFQQPDMNSKRILLSPSKILERINDEMASDRGLKGCIDGINDGMLSGWAAIHGSKIPLKVYIKVDNHHDYRINADEFRPDLAQAGINEGNHAFRLRLEQELFDGEEHAFALYCQDSNIRLSEKKLKLKRFKRSFSDFSSFLRSSYTNPELRRPLVEDDYRVLAAMETTANLLAVQKNEKIKFSVIMPAYNRSECISKSIRSVLNQSHHNFELIVIDDASTDGTHLLVKAYNDSRIILNRLERNVGVSAARNVGLENATGDYIAFLDSDNEWDSRHLACISAAIEKHPNAEALYTAQLLFIGDYNGLYGYRFGMPNINLLANQNYIDMNAFCHVNLRHRPSTFLEFDTTLPRYVDWEYIFKLATALGLQPVPVPTSHYFLNRAPNSITCNDTLLPYLKEVRTRNLAHLKLYVETKYCCLQLTRPVAIIIPSFEASDDLKACLSSIANLYDKYVKSGLLEIIVVDNNSTNEEKVNIRQDVHSIGGILIELGRNYGFTHAVNVGIEAAASNSDIVLLNNDAMLCGASLEILQFHASDSKVGLCVPAQILGAHTPTALQHVPFASDDAEIDVTISAHHNNVAHPLSWIINTETIEVEFAPFFCVYIKRNVIENAGPLNAVAGRHYRSDRTYCSIVRNLLSLKILYCPFSRVYHGLQGSTNALKQSSSREEYRRIFTLNTWADFELEALGFELPKWMDFYNG